MNAVAHVRPFRFSEIWTTPARTLGIAVVLLLRYLMALFFLGSSYNKISRGWLWSDAARGIFESRLAEIDGSTFSAKFLSTFAIPWYPLVAWVVTLGVVAVTISLALGLATRIGAALAVWLMVMFAVGGYYDASLIPLWLIAALFVVFPTGQWFGLDRRFHARYPASPWFR
jgi:thiosulfate dehydrogenase (quinone) large subunit